MVGAMGRSIRRGYEGGSDRGRGKRVIVVEERKRRGGGNGGHRAHARGSFQPNASRLSCKGEKKGKD